MSMSTHLMQTKIIPTHTLTVSSNINPRSILANSGSNAGVARIASQHLRTTKGAVDQHFKLASKLVPNPCSSQNLSWS